MSVHELERALNAPVRRGLVWTLGLGAFGLAFAITTFTYLPVILGRFTDSESLIALVLGAEGAFALLLSPVIGPWSDTFHTPLGRRRPFMLVALGPMAFCLCLVAFMPSLWTAALIVFAFFSRTTSTRRRIAGCTRISWSPGRSAARRASSTRSAASRWRGRWSAAASSSTFGTRRRSSSPRSSRRSPAAR